MRGNPNPYICYTENNFLYIQVVDYWTLAGWAEYHGEMQKEVKNTAASNICFDLTNCSNAAPIAILAAFLTLRNTDKKVIVKFPKSVSEDTNKLMQKLGDMGFLDLCKQFAFETNLEEEEYCCKIDKNILVPATIIDLKKIENVYEYVKSLVEKNNDFYGQERQKLKYKIEHILFETVENIKQHAYPGEETAWAGILVYKRAGYANKGSEICKVEEEYGINQSGIEMEYIRERKFFYEILVLDEGKGIAETLEIKNRKGKDVKYPFYESFIRTFQKGERKQYKPAEKKNCYYSGLNLIFQLLAESTDCVYGKEKEEFVYARCRGEQTDVKKELYQKEAHIQKGLTWMFHILQDEKDMQLEYAGHPMEEVGPLLVNCYTQEDVLREGMFKNIKIWEEREIARDISNIFCCTQSNLKDYYIWLTDGNYGKNEFAEKIRKKLEEITNGGKALFILDVPDGLLITLYNAIDRLSCTSTKCEKIIVVSHLLNAMIFLNKNGTFRYKRGMLTSYFYIEDFERMEKSIAAVLLFLRQYDSSIFWSKLLEDDRKAFLIRRGDIEWDELSLKYYINMEMILSIQAFCRIIQHSLKRTERFVRNFGGFKSIDIIMEQLCIETNYNNRSNKDASRIFVESVFVSGKTDQILGLREEDLKLCLFQNRQFASDASDVTIVPHLFIWPEEALLEQKIKYGNPLRRKGSSHAAEEGKQGNPADKADQMKQKHSKRNLRDTLYDMTHNFSGFADIGHFSYHSNHDIVAFNMTNIVKISFYEKTGVFVNILSHFVNAMGKDCLDDLKPEWQTVINDKTSIPDIPGICLYRSHYYNEYVFQLINKCFNKVDKIESRIISINTFEKKLYTNPMAISEIQYEYITSVLCGLKKEKGSINILIFDTLKSSGQTSHEIESMLGEISDDKKLSLNINKYFIFDCEPILYKEKTAEKPDAYYRYEFLRIGRKNSCPFCQSIENAIKYRNIFISRLAKNRIQMWAHYWRAVSPLFKENDHGFKNSRVSQADLIWEKVGIPDVKEDCDFFTLAIELIELSYISRDTELLVDICQEENGLSDEQRMQLLELQLILFCATAEDNLRLYHKTMKQLLELMNKSDSVNSATALAAILAINGNSESIYKILNEWNDNDEELRNEDVCILVAILCSRDKRGDMLPMLYSQVEYLLITQKQDLELLKQLHSQIYNVYGNWHSTYMEKLFKNSNSTDALLNICNGADNSLAYLGNVITEISPLAVNCSEAGLSNTEQFIKNVTDKIEEGRGTLWKAVEEIKKGQRTTLPEEHKDKLREVVDKIQQFHSTLFIPYGKGKQEAGKALEKIICKLLEEAEKRTCSEIQDEKEMPGKVRLYKWQDEKGNLFAIEYDKYIDEIKTEKSEVWYVWDRRMEEEFSYLISDVRHSVSAVKKVDGVDIHMKISVYYTEKEAKIKLETISKYSAEEIQKMVKQKGRYQREMIEKCGGRIEYKATKRTEKGKYDLTTTFIIEAVC